MARPFVLAGLAPPAGARQDLFYRSPARSRLFAPWQQGGVLATLLMTAALGPACVEQSSEPSQPSAEDVKAAHEHVLTVAPTPRFPSNAVLDNGDKGRIVYLGADVDATTVVPGQSFNVTHYFRVEKPVAEGWRLFVHLDGTAAKHAHLNADHVPIGGKYPVPLWKTGEIIADIHKVLVPPSWPADKVTIYVGFWKGQTRFAVKSGPQDGQNRVRAFELPVKNDAAAPPTAPAKRLVARKLPAGTAINIDGKLDEPAWKSAAVSDAFVNSLDGSQAAQAASAKVLWDDQNLYVAFDFADTDIWGSLEKHDDKIYTQEAAEMFIDPDGDGRTYIELQVSPRNVTFDSWLPGYRQNDNAWDAPMKTAVQVIGTLNKRDDTDTGWTVEMMIPLAAVKGRLETVKGVPPQVGTEWRINFFRMDLPAGKPQAGSAWSPPMRGDFHALDKFGTLVFGDEQGSTATTGPHTLNPVLQQAMVAEPAAPGEPAKTDKAQGTPAQPSGATATEPGKDKAPPAAAKPGKDKPKKGAPAAPAKGDPLSSKP